VNVAVTVTVGDVTIEAQAVECGPDAAGDLLRQAVVHMLTLVDRSDCAIAARGMDDEDTQPPA
jgi:hypothetical protein